MHESVSLDSGPVLYLVRGDVLLVDSHVAGGKSIGAGSSNDGHQFVIFIGYGNLGSLIADRVDLVVQCHPLCRIRFDPIDLEEVTNLVKHWLLSFIVRGSEMLCTLEHQVFQIMGETRSLMRIILASYPDCDIGLDARGLLVDGHVDFESIVEGVDLSLEGITLDSFVLVLCTRTSNQHGCHGNCR